MHNVPSRWYRSAVALKCEFFFINALGPLYSWGVSRALHLSFTMRTAAFGIIFSMVNSYILPVDFAADVVAYFPFGISVMRPFLTIFSTVAFRIGSDAPSSSMSEAI